MTIANDSDHNCTITTCLNGGRCVNNKCECETGFTGSICQIGKFDSLKSLTNICVLKNIVASELHCVRTKILVHSTFEIHHLKKNLLLSVFKGCCDLIQWPQMKFHTIFSVIYHKRVVGKGFLFTKVDSPMSESMTGVPVYKKADSLEHCILFCVQRKACQQVQYNPDWDSSCIA